MLIPNINRYLLRNYSESFLKVFEIPTSVLSFRNNVIENVKFLIEFLYFLWLKMYLNSNLGGMFFSSLPCGLLCVKLVPALVSCST